MKCWEAERERNRVRNRLCREQDNRCAICGRPNPGNLDHCHATLRCRGALCTSCNTILGLAKENIRILKRAIKYLSRDYSKAVPYPTRSLLSRRGPGKHRKEFGTYPWLKKSVQRDGRNRYMRERRFLQRSL